jgi:pimeloyl-ACP methyl ester carboxylesterase
MDDLRAPAKPSLAHSLRARARRAEIALGKAQLLGLQHALIRAARVIPRRVTTPVGEVAVLARLRPDDPAPLVFVHGFGGDKETWLLLALRLRRDRSLVLIDLPGHGGSAAIHGPAATPGGYASAVAAVLDELRLSRVVLIGNSLGGGVALRVARDAVDRIAAMVLVASVAPSSARSDTVTAWRRGDNPLIPGDTEEDHRAFIRLVTEKPPRVPRPIFRYVAARRAGAEARLAHLFAGYVDAPPEAAVPEDLDALPMPTLVLHGACDRVVPTTTAEELTRGLPRARLHVLPGIGHAPQLEDARGTARLIEGFLGEQGLAPGPIGGARR